LSTVDRAIKELIEIHALTKSPRYDDDGDRTSNLYQLSPPPSQGGRTGAATPPHERGDGSCTEATTGSRTDEAENENQSE
jgi:hypothetical protein